MKKGGRLTAKKLVAWCNEQFSKLEIHNYEVIEITRSYFSSDHYENGACRLYVKFRDKRMELGNMCSTGHFLCFYRLSEYQDYINQGYELYLKDNGRFGSLKDFDIEVRKIT